MIIGRIDWFGGQNNKTQIINNYGFVIPLEGDNTQGIYVHRDDVPVQLQNIIEGTKGKGVYVQFEIDINRNRAININLMKFIGTAEWSSRGTWRIVCEERSSLYLKSHELFHSEDVIVFGLRYVSDNRDEVILANKIDNLLDDKEIIEKCITSNNFFIVKKALVKYLLSKSTDDAIEFTKSILKKLELDEKPRNILITEIAQKIPKVIIYSSYLRAYLKSSDYNSSSYGDFIDKNINSVDTSKKQELINELIDNVNKASTRQRSIYWNQVKYLQENIDYRNCLWNIAPTEKKKQIIKDRFRIFFEIVSLFNNSDYPYAKAVSTDWRELYRLDEIDKKLASKWIDSNSKNTNNNFVAARMISARGAEKLAIKFYEALGYRVEDISAHQVTQKSQNWKQGDIRLNETDLLDVKNACSSVNSNVYSSFCVPEFKKNRGNDVKIIAVLSPYLQLEYIDGIKEVKFPVTNPKVLGCFDKIKLRQLEDIFSDRFIHINIISKEFDTKNYLPHWLFDYDEHFYVRQIDLIHKIQSFQDTDIPTWEDILMVDDCNPLPLFIAAKRQLPNNWLNPNHLPEWKVTFINYLLNLPVESISLAHLFLSLLKHFLSMLSYNASDFSPQKYLDILYVSSEMNRPIKLYDPLNTIKDFCDTLQSLWENRKKVNLAEFKIFKFNGKGLLQAKRLESESILTTILAYCGGSVDKKGKCGYTPLVIGKHENCLVCGRLICPKENCGYCSERCSSYEMRKKS